MIMPFITQEAILSTHNHILFKVCPFCSKNWNTVDEFLQDSSMVYEGYQSALSIFDHGLLFFTHADENCGTTMSIKADSFLPLYEKEKANSGTIKSQDCQECRLADNKLERCKQYCERIYPIVLKKIISQHITLADKCIQKSQHLSYFKKEI